MDGHSPGKSQMGVFSSTLVWHCLAVAFGGLLFGIEISIISGAQDAFQGYFNLNADTFLWGFVASSMTVGAVIGGGVASWVSDAVGRKWACILALLVYCSGVALEMSATTLLQLLLGRIIGVGVAIGALSSLVPTYIAELSPAQSRGAMVTLNQLLVCIGILLGFVATVALDSWRAQLASGLPIAACLAAYFVFLAHESPRWLLLQGRQQAAAAVLLALRPTPQSPVLPPPQPLDGGPSFPTKLSPPDSTPPHVAHEMRDIMRGFPSVVPGKKTGGLLERANAIARQLAVPHVSKALKMGIGLSAVQQLSGVQVTNYFAQDVYRQAGFSDSEAKTQAIYIGVAKVITVLAALALMDRLGRKRLLVGGLLAMAVAVGALGAVFDATKNTPGGGTEHAPEAARYSAAGLLIFFMGGFEIGAGPVVWVLLSELFPLRVKGPAMSIATTTNWLFNFVTGLFFPVLRAAFGISGVFFLFSAVAATAAVWVAALVPETKGLQLEQVEAVFRRGVPCCSFRTPQVGTFAEEDEDEGGMHETQGGADAMPLLQEGGQGGLS